MFNRWGQKLYEFTEEEVMGKMGLEIIKSKHKTPDGRELAVKQLQEALDKAKQDAAPRDTMSTMPVEDTATNNNQ